MVPFDTEFVEIGLVSVIVNCFCFVQYAFVLYTIMEINDLKLFIRHLYIELPVFIYLMTIPLTFYILQK